MAKQGAEWIVLDGILGERDGWAGRVEGRQVGQTGGIRALVDGD